MKKLIFAIIFLVVSQSYGQYNESAPWMNTVQKKSTSSKTTLQEISNSFNHYWKDKDFQKKGSGFKPFKRWESHWENYLMDDGTVATPSVIWKAFGQKQQISSAANNLSDWTSIGPFKNGVKSGQGRVNTFIIDPNNPNTYYVGAPAGGIWKSTNSGINWTPLSDDIPQIGVSGIAIDPNNSDIIYIATGDDDALDTYSVGILKSIDRGITWNTTGLDFSGTNSRSSEIYIDPTNSDIVWAATSKGLWRSLDAGINWSKKQSGNILDFKLKPNDPNTIYVVSAREFWKSIDGGESFVLISEGLPEQTSSSRMTLEITKANPEVVYVLSAANDNTFNGLYKSTDSGATFTRTDEQDDIFESSQAWYDMALTVSSKNENVVFVGVLNIWGSNDGGNNFNRLTNGYGDRTDPSFTHVDIHFLRFFNDKLYAGTDGGIYESKDDGIEFNDLTENLNISQYYRISTAKHSKSKVAGGLQDNGGFGYSNNTWREYHGGDGMECAIDPNQEDVYYGFTQFGGSLNITYNGGASEGGRVANAPSDEVNLASGDAGGEWITPLIMTNEGVLIAGYKKLYQLINGNWVALSTDSYSDDIDQMDISPTNNDIIYISEKNKLYKSVDGGVTFVETPFTFPNTISSIEINNQNSDIIYISNSGIDGDIYKSIDGAENWTIITANLPGEPKNIIKHQDQSAINDIYLGTALGVYHINDDMTEWEVYSKNLPNVPVEDIEINTEESTITVGTYGRGVWQSPIPVIKVDVDLSLIKINTNKNIQCGGASPVITVKNNGLNAFNQVEINYSIDGVPFTYNYSGNIAPNQSKEIEIPHNEIVDFGSHILQIEAIVANDAFKNNNVLSAVFDTNNSGEGQYINTFGDVNEDKWLVSSEGSSADLWQKGETTKFGGMFNSVYVTSRSRNYTDETTSYLTSPCYDLSRLVSPVLKFDMAFDIELDWDVLYMEYTINNGVSWTILGTANDTNWYNSDFIDPNRPITVGKQWTGTDTEIKEYSYNLSALNNESNIIFRFVFASDQAENGAGAAIDNFTIEATSIILASDTVDERLFNIYPNPANSEFNIQRVSYDNMQVSIYDITGKLVYREKNITESHYTIRLPKSISKGIYFLKITEGNKQVAKQLMIQ